MIHADVWQRPLQHCIAIILQEKKKSACQCRRYRFSPWTRKTPQALVQLSTCATTTEAHAPWSLCSAVREATGMRSRAPQLERGPAGQPTQLGGWTCGSESAQEGVWVRRMRPTTGPSTGLRPLLRRVAVAGHGPEGPDSQACSLLAAQNPLDS